MQQYHKTDKQGVNIYKQSKINEIQIISASDGVIKDLIDEKKEEVKTEDTGTAAARARAAVAVEKATETPAQKTPIIER